jgi:beta-1,4-mannooligosaccharide/beta-1,4-mannosyl-N-acetylglucosamine phosphorylase
MNKELVLRYDENPIIEKDDIPLPCNTVFNAASAIHNDEYILLLRVEGLEGKSFFCLARSRDGFKFKVEKKPVMVPSEEEPFSIYEKRGIEDPRVTKIGEVYYILDTAYSSHGPRLALAKTKNFRKFERIALVSQPENKDGALFPKKINGRYARLDRPSTSYGSEIWISYSEDLIHWGDSKSIMTTRPGFWDMKKIGAGPPPIETEKGWLLIYHGVKGTSGGNIYRLGCAMFELDDPSKLIGRGYIPILSPEKYYERVGDVTNVVFSCGTVFIEEKRELLIYYGACDTSICVASAKLDELVENIMNKQEDSGGIKK